MNGDPREGHSAEQTTSARIRWLTPEEGGRRSGPPTAKRYYATAVVQTFAEYTDEMVSIVVNFREGSNTVDLEFLVPEAAPCLHPGDRLEIHEGRRVVGEALVVE